MCFTFCALSVNRRIEESMQLPTFLEVYEGLISTSSISSTDPSWDQGNAKVIEKLATWFKDLGFHVEVIEVEPGKHNMIARMGEGEGGLFACWAQRYRAI